MKYPKILIPLFLLTMTSCSTGYPGTYSFQMGKNSGTHMAITMTLTDNLKYDSQDKEIGKEFNILFDVAMANDDAILEALKTLFPDGITLDGYYNIVNHNGANQLKLGFIISEVLPSGIQEMGITNLFTDEVIQKIVYSEIDNRNITLCIPVSVDDLLFQLYWYGHDFYYTNLGQEDQALEYRDVTPHDLNTHPTQEDIDAINQTYKTEHTSNYRDFHNLSLGLSRQ